ncbi:MAG: DUF6017 domain-containing protein, partial [Oscillospiraceae bacterium]|jgi:hypothetical protein|nr:DUF6017 domain-containing protein [Oscillospiraceae bacterium]
MSNHHLRNKNLSLKAKGLLSQMLSLPEDWDYTLKGLALINRESVDAIRTAVLELEQARYITRSRERNEKGQLGGTEYVIHELPQEDASPYREAGFLPETPIRQSVRETPNISSNQPISENPILENPIQANPTQVYPTLENPTQINKDIISTEEQNKEKIKKDSSDLESHQINQSNQAGSDFQFEDRMDSMKIYREIVKENIGYDYLSERFPQDRLDGLTELIIETLCSARRTIRIAGDEYPSEHVKAKLLKLNDTHIEYVFECIDKNTTEVRNIKSYLLTALYNAPNTISSYYTARVNHDRTDGWEVPQ